MVRVPQNHEVGTRKMRLKGALSRAALGTRFCLFGGEIYVLSSFFIVLDLVNPWPSDLETNTDAFFLLGHHENICFLNFCQFRKNDLGHGQVSDQRCTLAFSVLSNRWLWEHPAVRGPPPKLEQKRQDDLVASFIFQSPQLLCEALRSPPVTPPFSPVVAPSARCGPV